MGKYAIVDMDKYYSLLATWKNLKEPAFSKALENNFKQVMLSEEKTEAKFKEVFDAGSEKIPNFIEEYWEEFKKTL